MVLVFHWRLLWHRAHRGRVYVKPINPIAQSAANYRFTPLLIQEELVDLEKKLSEAAAAQALRSSIQAIVAQLKRDPTSYQNEQTRRKLAEISKQAELLKIPLSRRFTLWITGKSRAGVSDTRTLSIPLVNDLPRNA